MPCTHVCHQLVEARLKASVVDMQIVLNIAQFPKADEASVEDVRTLEKTVLDLANKCGDHERDCEGGIGVPWHAHFRDAVTQCACFVNLEARSCYYLEKY
ncbi:MAG: hypothetical protein IJ131_05455 [Eggerthellaceae bacterium]|nr:hypothetical protein [Eggerthellaceae bacterium]